MQMMRLVKNSSTGKTHRIPTASAFLSGTVGRIDEELGTQRPPAYARSIEFSTNSTANNLPGRQQDA
jgi:hypothetical protein